jgi:hypothetical protein
LFRNLLRTVKEVAAQFLLGALIIFYSILFAQLCAAGESEAEVTIRKVEDRTEATVSSTVSSKAQETSKQTKSLGRSLSLVEEETMDAAGASTTMVGKGADSTVEAVRSVGGSAFSWIFKSLDFAPKSKVERN